MSEIDKAKLNKTGDALSEVQNENELLDGCYHDNAPHDELASLLRHPRVISLLKSLTQGITYEFDEERYSYPPRRAYAGDAGLDIAIQEDVTIYPGESEYCSSGVKLFLPVGLYADVKTRSSTFKKRVHVIPTVVDNGYQSEISTIVSNPNSYPVTIPAGSYLAQVVVSPYFTFDNEPATRLGERGDNRFGSSS